MKDDILTSKRIRPEELGWEVKNCLAAQIFLKLMYEKDGDHITAVNLPIPINTKVFRFQPAPARGDAA